MDRSYSLCLSVPGSEIKVMAIAAGVTGFGYDWTPQFGEAGVGVPLSVLCLLKSFTLMFVLLGLFRRIDFVLCVRAYGCLDCKNLCRSTDVHVHNRTKRRFNVPKVILDYDYILECCWIKVSSM